MKSHQGGSRERLMWSTYLTAETAPRASYSGLENTGAADFGQRMVAQQGCHVSWGSRVKPGP